MPMPKPLHSDSDMTTPEPPLAAGSVPICFNCHKTPDQLPEYGPECVEYPPGVDNPVDFVLAEEGTYNPATGRFACTGCYIKIGMPTAPWPGWKAP